MKNFTATKVAHQCPHTCTYFWVRPHSAAPLIRYNRFGEFQCLVIRNPFVQSDLFRAQCTSTYSLRYTADNLQSWDIIHNNFYVNACWRLGSVGIATFTCIYILDKNDKMHLYARGSSKILMTGNKAGCRRKRPQERYAFVEPG